MQRQPTLCIVTAVAALAFVGHAAAQENCNLTAIGSAKVATVRDGSTLMLEDGRELRLAGIEVADGSRGALLALVGGRPLRLEQLGPEPARYGRRVGVGFPGEDGQARAGRRGHWAGPNFAPLQAEDLPRLQAERGDFALVEGKVLSARESGATIYVNFRL